MASFVTDFWIPLELTLQVSLLLILLGVFPERANALYLLANFVNLSEAAMALTLLVFHKENGIEETPAN